MLIGISSTIQITVISLDGWGTALACMDFNPFEENFCWRELTAQQELHWIATCEGKHESYWASGAAHCWDWYPAERRNFANTSLRGNLEKAVRPGTG
jgi:hypothetical protein